MNIHSKTPTRIRIFVAVVVLLAVVLAAAYFVRKRQIAARVLSERDLGYIALDQGDYLRAMHLIGPYVQRHPSDVAALVKYATARRNVEEPSGKHLVDSIALYRRVLELDPGHAESREQLLEIYLATGFNTEILTETNSHDDPPSLRARAVALSNLGRIPESLATFERYLAVKPADLRMQMLAITLKQRSGTSSDEIIAYATKLAETNANDPKFDLLCAFAYGIAENRDQALRFTLKATSQPLNDPAIVETAVDMLDSLGREDEAMALLRRAADMGKDEKSQRKMIARLFQSNQFDLVDQQIQKLISSNPDLNAELLAHHAMALRSLNRLDEADSVVKVLRDRKNDFAANTWAKVLAVLPKKGELPDDRAIIQACRDGLRGEADNPYFRLHLGDAYGRLGETSLATAEWIRASGAARVWGEPVVRLLRYLTVTASPEAVRAAAARLARLAPDDVDSIAAVVVAESRLIDRKDPAAVADLMQKIDRVQKLSPGESNTLALAVSVLALSNRVEEAKQFVSSHLAQDLKLPVAGYVALAQTSEVFSLGTEQACFDRCTAVHGPGLELAVAQARWMGRSGRLEEGLSLFNASREKASDRDNVGWQMAWAQLLDTARDKRSGSAWTELADKFPDNARVQFAALQSSSVLTNRELQRRIIDRLKSTVGENGIVWRMADTRWILDGVPGLASDQDRQRDLVKATTIVNDIVRQYPEQLDARLLLTDCLLRLKKNQDAIVQLTEAVRLSPGAFEPTAQLVALLQSAGEFERALPYLEQAARILESRSTTAAAVGSRTGNTPLPAEPSNTTSVQPSHEQEWRLVASLFSQRGDATRAVEILQRFGGIEGKAGDIGIAEQLAGRGELSEEACRKLLEQPTLSAIEVVAEQYARTGRMSDAESVLAKLQAVEAKPGERELIRGLYHRRRLAYDKALPELQQATQSLPTNEQAWRALLQVLIFQGMESDAASASVRAAESVPANAQFKRLAENQALIQKAIAIPRLRTIAAALTESQQDSEQLLAVLKIAQDANEEGKSIADVLALLRPIADRSPRLDVLQYLIVDLDQAVGNTDDALSIVTRMMQLSPTDPQPAQRATEMLVAGRRWSEVIPVAQQWQKRLGAVTLPADEALAMAYVATGRYDEALKQLDRYAAQATANPNEWTRILGIRAQALLGLKSVPDAEKLLFPSLASSAPIRDVVARLAVNSIQEPQLATRWLDEVERSVPANSLDERLAIAQAWLQLSSRPGQESLATRVKEQLSDISAKLSADRAAKSKSWVFVGIMLEQLADDAGSEKAYRAAIRIDPGQKVAMNNLAMLLSKDETSRPEAIGLAETIAKDEQDPNHLEYLDTLTQIQMKGGQLEAAERSARRATEIAPQNVNCRINLVQILLDAQKLKEARQAYDELEPLAVAIRSRDPQLDAKLKTMAASLETTPSVK